MTDVTLTNAAQNADVAPITTDVHSPAAERESRLPEDAFRREDYRGEVAQAVAKLRGVTHADGQTETDGRPSSAAVGDGPPRDENGRFAPKNAAAEAAAPAEGAAPAAEETKNAPTEDGQDAQPTDKQASTPAGGPPPGWSAESKAEFAKLPASVQADVLKREREVDSGFRQMSEQIKAWKEVDSVLAPRRQFLGSRGFASDAQVVNHLLTYVDQMERHPAGVLKALAESYNVDLRVLAGLAADGTGGSAEPEYVSPELAELRQQNAVLAGRLQQLEGTFASQQQMAEQRQQQAMLQEIQQFAADKPHFAKVRPLMGGLMQSGAAKTLDEAYQMACYADPEVRGQMVAAEEAKRRADEEAKRKEAAARQKAAAVQVRGAPGGGAAPAARPAAESTYRDDGREDVRADVLKAMRSHSARA